MIDTTHCRQFAKLLIRLQPGEGSERKPDVGTLAFLRRGLGKEYGAAPQRDGWVLGALHEIAEDDPGHGGWSDDQIEWACCVASLFADHRGVSRDRIGVSFRNLWLARDKPPSVAKRFGALLDADEQDIATHLRHAVRLLKANDLALDWGALLADLSRWGDTRRRVQRRWCADFWLDDRPRRSRKSATAS